MAAVRTALYQGPAQVGSVGANLAAIDRAAAQAVARGADILVSPELSVTGYYLGARVAEVADRADGEIPQELQGIAQRRDIAIVFGYAEAEGTQIYNTVQVVNARGETLATYRKTHLFGDYERSSFSPGDKLVIQFDFGGVRCGVLTCYDVEFPEAVRAHVDAGTQWLIVPTGLMKPFEHVATTVVPARAYENQLFVTYVNRCSIEGELEFCGLSCAVAPDGTELARAESGEELLVVDIDTNVLAASRARNTHLVDRRRDLYS